MPDFEKAFHQFGRMLHNVSTLLGYQCDQYVSALDENYSPCIEKIIKESINHKGRALNYFPLSQEKQEAMKKGEGAPDSWCGWHLDHDMMTGLASAMYINAEGKAVDNNDQEAGLYIKSRTGQLHRGRWKKSQIAFQIGESSQILSGGKLRATPHCVRGSSEGGVTRAQFVSFFQPSYNVVLNQPKGAQDTEVPRFKDGMDFATFSVERFKEYY